MIRNKQNTPHGSYVRRRPRVESGQSSGHRHNTFFEGAMQCSAAQRHTLTKMLIHHVWGHILYRIHSSLFAMILIDNESKES